MGKTPAKYPAFRPLGQEIQVGDLVRRQRLWADVEYGLGIVVGEPSPPGAVVRVLFAAGFCVVAVEYLEVLSEDR